MPPHPPSRPNKSPHVLAEAYILEIVLDDDVRDSVEHKLDVAGVGGTGEVGVDLLGLLVAVEVLKLALHVDGCLLIGVLALVVGKADGQRDALDLLGQQVLLVEEEDERGVGEPVVVANGVEEAQALRHATLRMGEGWERGRRRGKGEEKAGENKKRGKNSRLIKRNLQG